MGLLLLRLMAAGTAIIHDITRLEAGLPIGGVILERLCILAGILLMAGLSIPILGSAVAVLAL